MIEALIVLIVVGFCLWLVLTYVPLPPPIKTIIIVVVVLAFCIWLLNAAGITNLNFPR